MNMQVSGLHSSPLQSVCFHRIRVPSVLKASSCMQKQEKLIPSRCQHMNCSESSGHVVARFVNVCAHTQTWPVPFMCSESFP